MEGGEGGEGVGRGRERRKPLRKIGDTETIQPETLGLA